MLTRFEIWIRTQPRQGISNRGLAAECLETGSHHCPDKIPADAKNQCQFS